jgi:hypothetical protein
MGLGNTICSAMGNADCISVEKEVQDMNTTVFTSKNDGEIFLKPNRPALVVSSTSWSILLNCAVIAIVLFMFTACDYQNMRRIICFQDTGRRFQHSSGSSTDV